ncbi:MAG TPA: hypothetical protein VFR07_03410 [Mycobacteriales bacterium]|nr:hypothetical protein [Mycobacteriales bacterium]
MRLARQPVFLASLALNLIGFGLHVVALQSLPLFLVQAVIAACVAVTALLSVRFFGARLSRWQWLSVALVVLGLALLGPTAETNEEVVGGNGEAMVLLAAVLVAGLLSVAAARLPRSAVPVTLGLLAGVAYGVVALAARLLPDLSIGALLTTPASYVLAVAGAVAFLLYSTAMQRGSVTTTTAALVITQTAVPALVGVLLLGDRVQEGQAPVAVAGFLLALGGALGLARFESSPHPSDQAVAST